MWPSPERQTASQPRPTFAPWWKPWTWCRAWAMPDAPWTRCRLPRHHFGPHATFDGFGVRYFGTRKEGTP